LQSTYAPIIVESIPLQCANTRCQRRRGSLSSGETFQFEIVSISVAATDDQSSAELDETPRREKVLFWLCDACCETLTLTLDPMRGLQSVPREVPAQREPTGFISGDVSNR
jgi:hypothetical protein